MPVADELLVIDAVLFLFSCLLSYWALRKQNIKKLHKIGKAADLIFIIAFF